jgi:hypothetical protein
MQLVLSRSFAVVAAVLLLTQGDAADVRALLRQKLMADAGAMAGVGASCSDKSTTSDSPICTAPTKYVMSQIGGCTSSQVPLYTYNSTMATYVQVCGSSTCTYSDTIKADANVGGQSCTGNKNVKITVPGVQLKSCTPCLDAKMTTQPEDTANLVACKITDDVFGCSVKWCVGATSTINDFFVDVGKSTTQFFDSTGNAIAKGTTDTYNAAVKGTTDTYNAAAKGTTDTIKSAGKTFKKWGR